MGLSLANHPLSTLISCDYMDLAPKPSPKVFDFLDVLSCNMLAKSYRRRFEPLFVDPPQVKIVDYSLTKLLQWMSIVKLMTIKKHLLGGNPMFF